MKKTWIVPAACALMMAAMPVSAETVGKKVTVDTKEVPNMKKVDFSAFDISGDGVFTMPEVGERLFKSFDQNGDMMIDNREWNYEAIMTITPMEKETFEYVDYNDDGMAEETSLTQETFFKESGLIRFDKDKDGLSAKDFVNKTILEADKDGDQLLDMEEWKDVYLSSRPKHLEEENYNQ